MTKLSQHTGIEKAIEFAGSIRKLAALVDLKKSSIARMKKNGVVPPMRCQVFHDVTGVPLHELNPYVYVEPVQTNAA